jgi:putative pyoverdin transport system ATP-binding/permease protein
MNLATFLLRSSWLNVTIAALAGAISGSCSAALIAIVNQAISPDRSADDRLFLIFIGLVILDFSTSLISRYVLISLSQDAVYRLRLRLSGWILASPLRHLEELGANRLLATLTDDISSISNIVFWIPFLCIDLAIILGCLAYLCWLSPPIFLFILGFMVVAIATIQLMLGKARHQMELAREEQDKLFQLFRGITDGIKELKLNARRRQAFLSDELEVTADASRRYNVRSLSLFTIALSFGQLLFFFILGCVAFGLPAVTPIENSVLSGYIIAIIYLVQPLQSLLEILPAISRASVALQKVDELGLSLASKTEKTSLDAIESQPQFQSQFQHIELIQVTHTYQQEQQDNQFKLGPIDLKFYPGEVVFIVGGNGSGKSTLAKLIAGLYYPESGQVCWDNRPVTEENREAYRQLFSSIFSDFYLFDRLLGIELDRLDTHAQLYLQKLQIEHKVKIKEGYLSTLELSQGQRKRLALLTAYLEDRSIYLFDEWASDQDPVFREIFYNQLLLELKKQGKTALVISHDDRYFHLADRILKLDYGQLAN